MTPFGINYGTAAQVAAYPGRADLPAQPIWATDTNQLWIVDGTTGKYELAKKSDLLEVEKALLTKLDTSELETALKELIVEFGGQVPA